VFFSVGILEISCVCTPKVAPCIYLLRDPREDRNSSHPSSELTTPWLLQWQGTTRWSPSLLLEKMSHHNKSHGYVEILWKKIFIVLVHLSIWCLVGIVDPFTSDKLPI
jgi:hypothetical protein